MDDFQESLFMTAYIRLRRWIYQMFYCRRGHHNLTKVFADDQLPNPEYCMWCDFGWDEVTRFLDLKEV